MRLLVVGASGHLGGEICRQAVAAGWDVAGTYHRGPRDIDGVAWRRVDVRDASLVDSVLRTVQPDAVVNTAYAYDEWAVTADGAAHVARAAAAVGARLVHLSSDVLHAGRAEPYPDDEAPAPVHAYGAAKAAAETAVRALAPAAVLVRTSLIVGDAASPAVRFCLDLLAGRRTGALFTDEVRCPVAVTDLAAAVRELAVSGYTGLLNVAGPQPVTRAEFGRLVARHHGLDASGLRSSTIAESGLARPGRVELDSTRAAGVLRTRLRTVGEVLGG